jgi:hypothetical protein
MEEKHTGRDPKARGEEIQDDDDREVGLLRITQKTEGIYNCPGTLVTRR